MKTSKYPVFVDVPTATKLNITELEGRPEDTMNRDAVFVGFAEATTFELGDWPTMTPAQRAFVIDTANRQIVQDVKNAHRADIKDGGKTSLAKQRDALIASMNDSNVAEVFPKLQAVLAEIAAAKSK